MLESLITLGLAAVFLIGAPGPAAMALAATGADHKLHKGLPLIYGLIAGVLLTGLLTSIGMLAILERWPESRLIMQLAGGLFILIMALKMLRLSVADESTEAKVHFGFRSGILMNILNPKAYATFMVLITKFMPPIASKLLSVMVLEMVSLVATVMVTFGWLLFGGVLGRFISTAAGRKKMQVVFACLMIIFILPVLIAIPD